MTPVLWTRMTRNSRRLLFGVVASVLASCSSLTDNNLPTVSAGEDETLAEFVSQISLRGTVDDAEDGKNISIHWSQVSGSPAAIIDNPEEASTTVQIAAFTESPARFTFRLTASDSDGGSNFDDVVITIPKPQLSINANSDLSVNSGDEVNLHATVDYPDPNIVKIIEWETVSSPATLDLSGTNTADVHFIAPPVTVSTSIRFDVSVSITIGDATEIATDTVTVTVNPVGSPQNSPPTANAGPNFIASSGATISITGTANDSDGNIIGYLWTQFNDSAPTVQLANADTATVSFVAPTEINSTTIVLLLTVTDNLGATGTDQVSIRIDPANVPPVANAGGDKSAISGETVQISDGGSSDRDGTIVSYLWSRIAGPTVSLIAADTPMVRFTAPAVATEQALTLMLTVTDNDGATDSDEVVIIISPVNGNQPPTVFAGDDRLVNVGQSVVLTAEATDDVGITGYLWSNETNNGPQISFSGERTNSIAFVAPEVAQRTRLTFRITVTDDENVPASDDVIITINAPPVVNAGTDQTVVAGSVVSLNGSGSDADGTVESYLWMQAVPASLQLSNGDTPNAGFTAPEVNQATTFTFQLTVADNDGATGSDTVTVTVTPRPGNQPPTAMAGDDQSAHPRDVVTLSASGQDSDGTIAGYLWEHTPGQAQEPAIAIANPQLQAIAITAPEVTEPTTLTFTLTVSDNVGATGTDTVVVTVYPLATISGTITAANGTLVDSDTNAEGTTPVPNHPDSSYQHIPNPVILGGYVHQEGVGPVGSGTISGESDSEDVYHVNMTPGQVVNLYLGESYFDPDTDPSSPSVPRIFVWLTNDYATPSETIVYDSALASSGVLSLTAPGATTAPADGHYLIAIQAGAASAYSYVLTVGSAAPAQGWSTDQNFVPNELIVEFKEPAVGANNLTTLSQRASSVGMQALAGAPGRAMLLGFDNAVSKARAFSVLGIENRNVSAAINDTLQAKIDTISAAVALKQRSDVKSVRLNYIYYPTAVPNDSLYTRQWHYPLINLPQAWDTTTGSANVTVAVIDTGILSNHPDINASRLLAGYDFIRSASNAGDGNGIDPNPEDPGDGGGVRASSFHGTHVAGTIGANTNNGVGVAGVAWQVNIMPLRVLGINGGTEYDIEQAIRYAARLPNNSNTLPDRKADVINLSLGGPTNTTTAPQAYELARAAGVIIVAAAGNDGSNQPSAPAAYNGVVSVSAVTINRQRASYSNYGSTIDVAAPGGNNSDTNGDSFPDSIMSTRGSDTGNSIQYGYSYAAGTSMAAPHVAGVVALMKSVYPNMTPAEFDNLLASGDLTQDLGATGRDNNFGHGLIDAQKAVAAALSASGGTPDPPEPAVLAVTPAMLNFGSQMAVIEITIANSGAGTLTINGITEDSGGWLNVTSVSVDSQGLGLYAVSADRNALAQGIYTATIRVSSDNGTVDVPVSMQVFLAEVVSDAGPQVIELIDTTTQQAIQTLRVLPNNGVYDYSFANVRLGVYHVRSGSDLDNDGTLCELGESCGAYPTLDNTVSSDIRVDGSRFDINSLDFETGFHVNVNAQ